MLSFFLLGDFPTELLQHRLLLESLIVGTFFVQESITHKSISWLIKIPDPFGQEYVQLPRLGFRQLAHNNAL